MKVQTLFPLKPEGSIVRLGILADKPNFDFSTQSAITVTKLIHLIHRHDVYYGSAVLPINTVSYRSESSLQKKEKKMTSANLWFFLHSNKVAQSFAAKVHMPLESIRMIIIYQLI